MAWQYGFCPRICVFRPPPPHNLVVGSSLAQRLDSRILEEHQTFNLAFSGGSALSGLMIIKAMAEKTGRLPRRIYVEKNILLMRGLDEDMLETLFHPLWYRMRDVFPALLEKYQPLNLIYSVLKRYFGKSDEQKANEARDERVYNMQLKNFKDSYQQPLQGYEKNLILFQELVAYFESVGVEIVLFDMPIDNELAYERLPQHQHEILQTAFPQLHFLQAPNHIEYTTNDGIHLMNESALRFTREFVAQMKSYP